jgi:hypothetical protein
MQVLGLIDYFSQLATLHNQIESFKTGDVWEVAIAGEDIYPQLWLDQIFNYQENRGKSTWNVSFMILAKQLQDESDENMKLDLAHTIGLEVIEKIKQDNLYQISDEFSAVSFTEAFEDFLCGWRFEIELCTLNSTNRCDIPGYSTIICSYFANIVAPANTTVVDFTTNDGPFTLPSLPAEFASLSPTALQVLADALIAEFETAGFIGVEVQTKDSPNEMNFVIKQTDENWLCLNGDNSSIMFTPACNCEFEVIADERTGDAILGIVINMEFLVLPSLPLDLKLTNTNIAADIITLQNELIGLGYEATVTDVTGAAPNQFSVQIIVQAINTDVFRAVQGPLGFETFDLDCN